MDNFFFARLQNWGALPRFILHHPTSFITCRSLVARGPSHPGCCSHSAGVALRPMSCSPWFFLATARTAVFVLPLSLVVGVSATKSVLHIDVYCTYKRVQTYYTCRSMSIA